ncbi:MAG TPA: hypothetical protein H9746_00310 [Candidatus Butyricicoccus avistercoris]|uniref:Uncharacterized protein n=1 Tax=Candidatus Butyricicoccus avistercoris TaxID=2838518 RepID=A0A9D1TGY7_9FIRM|nr:hypothetical protein [Candidatus Butyricicoccus avistercoris]
MAILATILVYHMMIAALAAAILAANKQNFNSFKPAILGGFIFTYIIENQKRLAKISKIM